MVRGWQVGSCRGMFLVENNFEGCSRKGMPPRFVGAVQNFDFALFCAIKIVHAAASVNI